MPGSDAGDHPPASPLKTRPETIWMTRSPVPAASGVAFQLGWMEEAFAREGVAVKRVIEHGLNLVARDPEQQDRHLFREGGNIQALAGRSFGTPTRVIGLTWIDERQAIIVRPDTPVLEPADLKGLRFALPGFGRSRGESIARGMSLHGILAALSLGGLTLDDVELVEVPAPPRERPSREGMRRLWLGLEWLAAGRVDAVYVKGAAAAEAVTKLGLEVAVDLDAYPGRLARINNGTPRPIIVHQHMLDNHLDLVEHFLEQTLRAADWAALNPADLKPIIAHETFSGIEGVETAHRNNFHRSLHPDLSEDRIEMLRIQANFLWVHGFIESPVDIDNWVCREPLDSVMKRRALARTRADGLV